MLNRQAPKCNGFLLGPYSPQHIWWRLDSLFMIQNRQTNQRLHKNRPPWRIWKIIEMRFKVIFFMLHWPFGIEQSSVASFTQARFWQSPSGPFLHQTHTVDKWRSLRQCRMALGFFFFLSSVTGWNLFNEQVRFPASAVVQREGVVRENQCYQGHSLQV